MSVKLLTERHLEILSLKGGCTGSSESTLVKMPHVAAHFYVLSRILSMSDTQGSRLRLRCHRRRCHAFCFRSMT